MSLHKLCLLRLVCQHKPVFLFRLFEGWRFETDWYQWWWRDCLHLNNLGGWRRTAFLWVPDRYEGIPTKYHCATTWTSFRGDGKHLSLIYRLMVSLVFSVQKRIVLFFGANKSGRKKSCRVHIFLNVFFDILHT